MHSELVFRNIAQKRTASDWTLKICGEGVPRLTAHHGCSARPTC